MASDSFAENGMGGSSAHAYDQVSQYYDRLRDHYWAVASAAQCAQALAAMVGSGTALELGSAPATLRCRWQLAARQSAASTTRLACWTCCVQSPVRSD